MLSKLLYSYQQSHYSLVKASRSLSLHVKLSHYRLHELLLGNQGLYTVMVQELDQY